MDDIDEPVLKKPVGWEARAPAGWEWETLKPAMEHWTSSGVMQGRPWR